MIKGFYYSVLVLAPNGWGGTSWKKEQRGPFDTYKAAQKAYDKEPTGYGRTLQNSLILHSDTIERAEEARGY